MSSNALEHGKSPLRADDQRPYLADLTVGNLTLNPRTGHVTRPQLNAYLTVTQTALLHFLMTNPGTPFRDTELVRRLWGKGYSKTTRHCIRQHVRAIRVKIEPTPSAPVYLVTLLNFGYMIATVTTPTGPPNPSHIVEATDPLSATRPHRRQS